LRFWGLGRFDTLVFDEVYFAKFGHHYLTHTEFFDAHPPLGKYLIALGIALKGFNPWGYRWVNALVGSFLPLLLAGIACQLSRRLTFALIAAGLASLDGLLLVESRYALLNVHILFFGLLAHWLVLIALDHKGTPRLLWLTGAGVSFGATIAVKWNGLGFLLGLYLAWLVAKGVQSFCTNQSHPQMRVSVHRLSETPGWQLFVYLPAIALVIYSLLWIPHLAQNPDYNFWQVHEQMFGYHHQRVGGSEVHPYCSRWYTWPLLLKPISYFYQTVQSTSEPVPIIGPPLPPDTVKWVYSVYATGNPLLWWSTTIAIFFVLGRWLWQSWQGITHHLGMNHLFRIPAPEQIWIPLYLSMNYLANFLPWIGVSRCTFLYHYMPASMFSTLAMAWLIDGWLQEPDPRWRTAAVTLLFVSVSSFMLWLPLFLGLPVTPRSWQLLRGQFFS
jgi:dolichyl-phosphate-mannose--protein O-mannosyl transferase